MTTPAGTGERRGRGMEMGTRAGRDAVADTNWRAAHSDFTAARARAYEAACRSLREGRGVSWQHGERWRSGVVIKVLGGDYMYDGGDVLVEATSGKQYRVPMMSILRARGDDE